MGAGIMSDLETQSEDQQSISPYVLPSEKVLWTGRPPTGMLLRRSDGFLIPFSLLWGGFAVFWEFTAYQQGAPAFFLLFGGFFVMIGLYMIAGRFVTDMWVRENTVYAITEERALILGGLFTQTLKALTLKNQQQISLERGSDGRGTILFGSSTGVAIVMNNPSWPGMGRVAPPMFEKIRRVDEVYQLVQSRASQ